MFSSNERSSERELETLYRISRLAATGTDNISKFFEETLDIMSQELEAVKGALTLRSQDSDIFVIEASFGITAAEKKRGRYKLGEGVTGQVAKTGKSWVIPDISKEPNFLNKTGSRKGDKIAFICVPITHAGRVIGTISIDLPGDSSDQSHRRAGFLGLIANILAESIANIRDRMHERESLMEENRLLRRQLGDKFNVSNIIGNCGSMRQVYEQIAQVAPSTATALIRGESGTGKELVARAIHYGSDRKDGAFICVNCAALPENLIESELFGHEKGAFTSAIKQRKGRFELADGGTIFLDEIGELSPLIQAKFLRVLQEQSFERVGGDETIRVNARIIAATNRDLEKAMREGLFREDLYYRLNVFPIHLPPLRERKSDIILLADFFLREYGVKYGKNIKRISSSAINMMMSYHWPGNVRELENCVERAVLTTADDVVHGYSLPPSLQTSELTHTELIPEGGADFKTMVESYEKELIIDALKKNNGVAAAAAKYLNTTKRVISYKISNLGISPNTYK